MVINGHSWREAVATGISDSKIKMTGLFPAIVYDHGIVNYHEMAFEIKEKKIKS